MARPPASVDQAIENFRKELERVTKVRLALKEKRRRDTEEYTRLSLVFTFPSGAKVVTGDMTGGLHNAMYYFVGLIAAGRASEIRSVRYEPTKFEDAVMFTIKINWNEYEGANEITVGEALGDPEW